MERNGKVFNQITNWIVQHVKGVQSALPQQADWEITRSFPRKPGVFFILQEYRGWFAYPKEKLGVDTQREREREMFCPFWVHCKDVVVQKSCWLTVISDVICPCEILGLGPFSSQKVRGHHRHQGGHPSICWLSDRACRQGRADKP